MMKAYQDVVKEKIMKAKENGITIVGITSDNLPIQIRALSHESQESIQNKFSEMKSIIHLRCVSHLLILTYRL